MSFQDEIREQLNKPLRQMKYRIDGATEEEPVVDEDGSLMMGLVLERLEAIEGAIVKIAGRLDDA